ncbi:MAG: tetratricopeptide repeat protein [Thermoanaerobaculia bacterium]
MLRLLARGELPWHRRLAARFRDVSGIVVVGDVHGDVRQLAAGAQELRLDWKPLRGGDPLAWLHWKARLAPTLVGREREMDSLRRWAREGRGVRGRVVSGEGGMGKTRLAAELARELREEGWQAGFADLRGSADGGAAYRMGGPGTLVLLDYPEEHREATRELLRDLASLEGGERLRVLLLSRRGDDLWQPEIDRADAYSVFDQVPLELGPLQEADLYRIFLEARDRVPARDGTAPPVPVDEAAFSHWLVGEPAHRRPLFVLAAAIESALEPERPVVRLSGRQVIRALARRELTRLRDEGEGAGFPAEALPRLAALAAVAGGLDAAALRRLAEAEGSLELGLPPPEQVMDRLEPTGRLVPEDGARRFPAPAPDLVAAALLVEVLSREPDLAPERLWAAAAGDLPGALERIGRLAYDAEVTLELLDQRPSEWLRRALDSRPERCRAAAGSFYEAALPAGLVPAAPVVWEALLDPDGSEEERAEILNNRSVHLAAAGRAEEALRAIEEAVEIRRRLAAANPARYGPELAQSLNNLSVHLAVSGRGKDALGASEQAVVIYRRLASAHPAGYEPELASSLNNLSNRLAESGRGEEAVGAVKEAVGIQRRLAAANPARYEPELAKSLNNLSVHLAASCRGKDALGASEEAVGIYRRLAAANPARYEPGLAQSLNNLSADLAESRRGEEALEAIEEAVKIDRRLAASNPARYEPELAASLNNLSNRLAESGRRGEALAANRVAWYLIEPYVRRAPDGLHGRWAEEIRSTLERLMAEASGRAEPSPDAG